MSVLDDLERQLSRSVDAGAASGLAQTSLADGRARRRWWRRRGGRLLVGILVAGGVTTGALAATGVLRVVPEEKAGYLPMVGDEGAGVPATPVKVLPLRVADPLGGPPWVIRTFTTNRKAACGQVGQLYRGHFGRVERDAHNRPVFRRIGIHIGETARCTNATQANGLPVLRGLRQMVVRGGTGSRARCSPARGTAGACPVDAVAVVRWGLLGPAARQAWFVRDDGTRSSPLGLSAESGGAYLFVESVDSAPARRYQEAEERIRREVERRLPRPKGSFTSEDAAERRRLERWISDTGRLRMKLYRQEWARLRRAGTPVFERPRDGIDATFADGTTLRAAGRGVSHARLPGVVPVRDGLPASLPADIAVEYSGRHRAIHVRFDAPVPLDRYARAYRAEVTGPRSPDCDRVLGAGEGWAIRAPSTGFPVRITIKPIGPNSGPERRGWCPGTTYTVRVVHHTGTNPGGRDRPVGTAKFVVP